MTVYSTVEAPCSNSSHPYQSKQTSNGWPYALLHKIWTVARSQEKNSRGSRGNSGDTFVSLNKVVKAIVMWCSVVGIWCEMRLQRLDLEEYKIQEPARGFWVWPPLLYRPVPYYLFVLWYYDFTIHFLHSKWRKRKFYGNTLTQKSIVGMVGYGVNKNATLLQRLASRCSASNAAMRSSSQVSKMWYTYLK